MTEEPIRKGPMADPKLERYNQACVELSKAKAYLKGTDYIDNKLFEAMLEGSIEEAKAHYAETLAKRASVRRSIDALEQEAREAYKALAGSYPEPDNPAFL